MEEIFTPNAPKPAGHYSQAVVHNGCIFVSGQLPIVPGALEMSVGTIEEQTLQALKNVSEILKAGGSDINHVLKATIYISDIELWPKVNEVYSQFFKKHRPARAVVPTKELHFGFQIEIEAIAALIG